MRQLLYRPKRSNVHAGQYREHFPIYVGNMETPANRKMPLAKRGREA